MVSSRGLPHNPNAERWLIGALLAGQDRFGRSTLADLGDLETIDFYDCRHQMIMRTILDRRDRGESCDALAVAEDLERRGLLAEATGDAGAIFLVQLMDETPSVLHLDEWTKAIRDAAIQRETLLKAKSLAAGLHDPTADPSLLAEEADRLAALIRSGKKTKSRPHLELVRVSEVEAQAVEWLWPNRVPLGKLTLLCGDPGLGKSHLTADIAARVTTGSRWPDDPAPCLPGSVILFSAEDDVADTIRPRLERAGADVTKVHVLESVKARNPKTGIMERRSFSLADDLPALEQNLQTIGDVKLLVIDPVSSYTGGVDSHKNAEVRSLLAPLAELAQRYGVAVLAVTHLSKGAGGKAVYRATGSLAFAAAARAVWMIAKDLDEPTKRLLLPVKCNIAPELSGLSFHIQSDFGGSFVAWDANPIPMTADGYLLAESKQQENRSHDPTALDQAVAFLENQLADGPMLTTELKSGATANGISAKTLERARDRSGVKARKREDRKWEVYFPDRDQRQSLHHGEVDDVGGIDGVDLLNPDQCSQQDRQERQRCQDIQEDHVGDLLPD